MRPALPPDEAAAAQAYFAPQDVQDENAVAVVSSLPMTDEKTRTPFQDTRLYREVAYLHQDEAEALAERAQKERCSKTEIIRRALRGYLEIGSKSSESSK